jgi:hypothetical protein
VLTQTVCLSVAVPSHLMCQKVADRHRQLTQHSAGRHLHGQVHLRYAGGPLMAQVPQPELAPGADGDQAVTLQVEVQVLYRCQPAGGNATD